MKSVLGLRTISYLIVFLLMGCGLASTADREGIDGRYEDGELKVDILSVEGKQFFAGQVLGCLSKESEPKTKSCQPRNEVKFWITCSQSNGENGDTGRVEITTIGHLEKYVFDGRENTGFLVDASFMLATDFCDKTAEGDSECDDCEEENSASETAVLDAPIAVPKSVEKKSPKPKNIKNNMLKTSDAEIAGVRALVIAMEAFYKQKRPPFSVSDDDLQKIIRAGIALDVMCNPNDPRKIPSEGHAAFCYYAGTLVENQKILGWLDFSLSTYSFAKIEELEMFYDRLDMIGADAEKIGSVKFPSRK